MPASLSQLMTPEVIDLDMRETSLAGVVKHLSGLLSNNPDVENCDAFCKDVLASEALSNTALGNGVAFPHARSDAVKQIVVVAGRTREGVRLGDEGPPVHLFFLIGTPKAMIAEYLALVSRLARRLRSETMQKQLMTVSSPEEFAALVAAE